MDKAITVWKDGRWKLWSRLDACYARNDPDWLLEFSPEVFELAPVDII